jgi:uncharacterized repeat protein (TIGR03803 family)
MERLSAFGARSFWLNAVGFLAVSLVTSAQAGELILHAFAGGPDGNHPRAGLIMDQSGNLYGTTENGGACRGCGTVFEISPTGSKAIIHAFPGGKTDGKQPEFAKLLMDRKGNLYGTTPWGGGGCAPNSCGTVFKIKPDGSETVLVTFDEGNGAHPVGGLILDKSETLYGTTLGTGAGTVFKMAPNGNYTLLYDFPWPPVDNGVGPVGSLVVDGSGNLYGVTEAGGTGKNCGDGCGTIFRVAPDGTETVLYSFQGGIDGLLPQGGLAADGSGNFYGTTELGGSGNCINGTGCGTVFKFSSDGVESILYSFKGGDDGSHPMSDLISDKHGDLFGTTWTGGRGCSGSGWPGCGTVFKISPNGTETVLLSFGGRAGGSRPIGGLVADAAGDLFGTTSEAGPSGGGAVFELVP